MNIETEIPLLERILPDWKDTIGAGYQDYRNHVYRIIHFCFSLKECSDEERKGGERHSFADATSFRVRLRGYALQS